MKYYIGEIYVTHRKVLWWWVEYTEKFSITLIQAPDWLSAREKCKKWHDDKTEELNGKYRTTYFTTSSI